MIWEELGDKFISITLPNYHKRKAEILVKVNRHNILPSWNKQDIFGAGIPLLFFVVSFFIKLSDDLDFLKYFTLNTLFDTQKILDGIGYAWEFISMLIISIILYITGIVVFKKRDLPI